MSSRRIGIVSQTVILTVSVAAISALVAALVALPLIRGVSISRGQETLGRLADLTARSIDSRDLSRPDNRLLPPGLVRALQASQVEGYLITPEGGEVPGLTAADVDAVLAGQPISGETEVRQPGIGAAVLIYEGRALASGGAVVLQQTMSAAGAGLSDVLSRFAFALILGLLFASLVGYLAARRLTRPLREVREGAHALAEGQRDVVLEPSGPAEVADLAEAINVLNAALNNSEGRQREFLLSVSHELRTPLTAVKGYAEALADGVVTGDDVSRTGAVVATEAQRLDRLVNDLLELARLGAVNFRIDVIETSVNELMAETCEVWTDRCSREGVTLQCAWPAEPLVMSTDPMRVRQILDNLLENALRVTPTGGRIEVAVERGGLESLEFRVRDSGPGLTGDDAQVAFEPGVLFERYRGQRPVGTGIGLALVGRLAEGLGGQAHADSLGSGAQFRVILPLRANAAHTLTS